MTVEQPTMALGANDASSDAPGNIEPAELNVAPAEGTPDTADDEQQQSDEQQEPDDRSPSAEAKKWRLKLRKTEAELSSVRGQLEVAQRELAEYHAAKVLRQPKGLWAADVPLSDLVDESGAVVPERVETAAREAAVRLGLERTGMPRPDMSQGAHGQPAGSDPMVDAFKPQR